jgi:arabinose-5-phosphate isomerase
VAQEHDSQQIWGLITDGDLRRALQSHPPQSWNHLTARDLMTADPITIAGDLLAIHALERMERNRRKAIGVLPVVEEGARMVGLLRLHDLVQAGLTTS